MTIRRGLLAFALVLGAGLIAMIVSGSVAKPSRAFSLYVANVGPVTTLAPGHRACESPVDGPAAFGGVRVWAASVGEPGILRGTVSQARGSGPLAQGLSTVTMGEAPVTVGLNATVPAHRQVRVCWVDVGATPVALFGSGQREPAVRLTVDGKSVPLGLSMVMMTPRPRSFLSQLSTIFSRAALFRPTWVGSWTFWLMLNGVIAAIGLGGVAVALADADADGQ